MRRLLCIVVVILLLTVPLALAHSGRTDSDGGHYDRSTGEYHYHHGMSAHQHPGGVCPYDDKPAATVKPTKFASVYAYRSDQYANALKATAKPTIKSSEVSRPQSYLDNVLNNLATIVGLFFTGAFVGLYVAVFSWRKNKRLKARILELESALNQERASAETHLANYCSEAEKHRALYQSMVSLQREFQSAKQDCRSLTDSLICAKREKNCLEKQLDDLGKQYNDLYSIWSESQLVGTENHAIVSEAMVFVGPSGIYHTRIHGDWHNYRLIPLSEALALRYRPCSLCVPAERFKS